MAGDPKLSQGELVRVEGMTAQAWEMDGRSGMAFRANAIRAFGMTPPHLMLEGARMRDEKRAQAVGPLGAPLAQVDEIARHFAAP